MHSWGRAAVAAPVVVGLFALSGCSDSPPRSTAERSSSSTVTSANSTAPSATRSSSTSASASQTSVAPPAPVTGKPGSITIGASGDVIAHPSIVRLATDSQGFRFDRFFAPLAKTTAADDVSICQMENPLSETNTDLAREMSFNAPHQLATTIKAIGFDGCSTANNHTFDRGLPGVASTRHVMAANGLKAAGPGATADEKGQPVFYSAKGFTVAQLSYSYSLNNLVDDIVSTPPGAPWTASAMWALKRAEGIEQDARAARADGADLVVVSLHWGQEYKPVTTDQKDLASALLRSGQVDWIIGNHPHVVQPCQKIAGRYVTYALGNFFSGQLESAHPGTADSAYANVTFTRDAKGTITERMTYQPTYEDQGTRVIERATPTNRPDSYRRTTSTMALLGCDATPTS